MKVKIDLKLQVVNRGVQVHNGKHIVYIENNLVSAKSSSSVRAKFSAQANGFYYVKGDIVVDGVRYAMAMRSKDLVRWEKLDIYRDLRKSYILEIVGTKRSGVAFVGAASAGSSVNEVDKEAEALSEAGGGGGGGGAEAIANVPEPKGVKRKKYIKIEKLLDCKNLDKYLAKSRADRTKDNASYKSNLGAKKKYWEQYPKWLAGYIARNEARWIKEKKEAKLKAHQKKLKNVRESRKLDLDQEKELFNGHNKKRIAAEKAAKTKCKIKPLGGGGKKAKKTFEGVCEFDSDYDSLGKKCGKKSSESKSGGWNPNTQSFS